MARAIFNDQRHPLNRVGADTACARSQGPWDYRCGCSNGSRRAPGGDQMRVRGRTEFGQQLKPANGEAISVPTNFVPPACSLL